METASGMTVFTQDDLNANAEATRAQTRTATTEANMSAVREVLKDEVREDNLQRDYATSLYNTIAEKVGTPALSSIGATYQVEVIYEGDVIMTINGIEADDEDLACEAVSNDISVDDVELRFTISHGSDYETVEMPQDSWDITQALDFNAIEE